MCFLQVRRKPAFLNRKAVYTWPFSIAMFICCRVNPVFSSEKRSAWHRTDSVWFGSYFRFTNRNCNRNHNHKHSNNHKPTRTTRTARAARTTRTTRANTEAFYTQKLSRTEAFTHRGFYTQTTLHTDAFTHRRFYTQMLLHTNLFTHRNLYKQTFYAQNSYNSIPTETKYGTIST